MNTRPTCATCAAYEPGAAPGMGLCRLLPPTPLFGGMQQQPRLPGLQLGAGANVGSVTPLIFAAVPQTAATAWCMQHMSTAEPERTHRQTEFVDGVGLVTTEQRAERIEAELDRASHELHDARAAEGAKHQGEPWSSAREPVEDADGTA
jgi:hypothetical protein